MFLLFSVVSCCVHAADFDQFKQMRLKCQRMTSCQDINLKRSSGFDSKSKTNGPIIISIQILKSNQKEVPVSIQTNFNFKISTISQFSQNLTGAIHASNGSWFQVGIGCSSAAASRQVSRLGQGVKVSCRNSLLLSDCHCQSVSKNLVRKICIAWCVIIEYWRMTRLN